MPYTGYKITDCGNYNATKCVKITFSTALSTAPKIEAWDNSQVWPAKDASGSTFAKEIFTGTAGFTNPMLAAWSGGAEADGILPGAAWHPAAATGGSANPNLLKGTTNYVTCTNTPGLGGDIILNISLRVPYNATVPSTSSMAHILQIRYTYTGDAPTLAYYGNNGTESAPNWAVFTPGTEGIKYCNSGTTWGDAAAVYKLTLPAADTVDAPEIGIPSWA